MLTFAVWCALAFVAINCAAIWAILHLKNRGRRSRLDPVLPQAPDLQLDPQEVLGREYEYAKTTASEAMADRHTMVNFYLLLIGVVASGVLANLDKIDKWQGGATFLLWTVCAVGWLYFLILVRLREAWYDSVKTMLRLRDFCIRHAKDVEGDILIEAFRWRAETLPAANKAWSVFFYSALLIGFLDTMAFVTGAHLLASELKTVSISSTLAVVALGIGLFAFHISMYFALLAEPKSK